MLKELFGGSLLYLWLVVLSVIAVVIGIFVWQQFEGDILSRDFENKQKSSGAQTGMESAIRQAIVEYNKAETGYLENKDSDTVTAQSYKGQMDSNLQIIWALQSDLTSTPEDIQLFLNSHPLPQPGQ